ncbi:MAG: M4 family peptidase [Bacteroidia bacterium]|nr:MAG: M4 family peptidase [Bacteroidia bacterium]
MAERILEKGTPGQKKKAEAFIRIAGQIRGQRQQLSELTRRAAAAAGERVRKVYDAQNGIELPGTLVRSEGNAPTGDAAVDEAYDGSGATFDLYSEIFNRNSINNRGMDLRSTVHFMEGYDNAFWNGEQMVYGDGDEDMPEEERLFNRFTVAIDIIAHELTHGVTQYEANLVYRNQAGALNESISDVFGSLVKQRVKNQTAAEADWLIGEGLFTSNVNAQGIRSMKAPGTAYDDPLLGRDPQPGHMNEYVDTIADNGGVHINSGIPNKAFYNIALELGGYAWEKAGQIWYKTLCEELDQASDFQAAADSTHKVAGNLYGNNSTEQKAVYNGWKAVGIIPATDQGRGCRGFVSRAWRSIFGGRNA